MQYYRPLTMMALAAIALVVAVSPARAQTVTGMWNLVSVNGQALPVVIETNTNCEDSVLSGMLMLSADGDWELQYKERDTCGTAVEEEQEEADGDYTVDGQTVVFSDDTEDFDPNDLEIKELGIGTLNGNELSVKLEDGQTVLLFRRG